MDTITTGVNKKVNLDVFSQEEKRIITILTTYGVVTWAQTITISGSQYRVILLKPNRYIKENFNLQREIIVVFSAYESFEPRSIDALEYMDVQELRLEEICSIIISKDANIEKKVGQIIKSNQETRVIIPFSYGELLLNYTDSEYVVNKMRLNFYSRDLFDIQDPLKKDLYFFGRTDLINTLVNKHLQNENAGVFGLRKTGKTSIIYGVERVLKKKGSIYAFVDCQTLHMKSYNMALFSIIDELAKESKINLRKIHTQEQYCQDDFVMDYFLEDIEAIYKKSNNKILIIFDEIEHITFDTSISPKWKKGDEFIKFWQVIRSTYQKSKLNAFTYLIAGTNPRCVETPTINGVDNPIFFQFSPIYIPAFDYPQTKEMIDKLGGYMGLQLDEHVCSRLVEDFGGHPLLMRQMCSHIHNNVKKKRPCRIISVDYDDQKYLFLKEDTGFMKYATMVLEVLENWYHDEYDMLIWLAIDDIETFKEYAQEYPKYIDHLLKYGIVFKHDDGYYFAIDALKSYLQDKYRYKRLHLTNEDKQKEISERRNRLENELRKIVRRQLRAAFGEEKAKNKVLQELYPKQKDQKKHLGCGYAELFDAEKHKIFFKNLLNLMISCWEQCFRNIFDCDVEMFKARSQIINYTRKSDAHAAEISDADFTAFRGAIEWFENVIKSYN